MSLHSVWQAIKLLQKNLDRLQITATLMQGAMDSVP